MGKPIRKQKFFTPRAPSNFRKISNSIPASFHARSEQSEKFDTLWHITGPFSSPVVCVLSNV